MENIQETFDDDVHPAKDVEQRYKDVGTDGAAAIHIVMPFEETLVDSAEEINADKICNTKSRNCECRDLPEELFGAGPEFVIPSQ